MKGQTKRIFKWIKETKDKKGGTEREETTYLQLQDYYSLLYGNVWKCVISPMT